MDLAEKIQAALSSNKAIIGFRRSLKFIKSDKPQSIIIANNLPDSMRKSIEDAARLHKIKVEIFDGDSVSLGVACGKPFPISVVVVKA
jgi:large subunit ribosomal protein L30e